MRYWLMKSEPEAYSIDDLERDGREIWDGVRNYQARNYLREMRPGDLAFFYHSNAKPPGVVGLMRIVKSGVVDPTQFDPESRYFDPKSTPENPRWQTVEVEFVEKFPRMVPLPELRERFNESELPLLKRGFRLSVMPLSAEVAEKLLGLAKSKT
ncbi:MAG TPA: EVE domain-containing protein [Oceanithermus profundus]|uniref:EVE domain-containing protein n=1 Tax=Oceanithermus profundus TaxID=187137 RepID=A0A7C4V4C3_9DEIN|nr:EVE domain-containing protein [Oceanithermus profundus]